MVEMIRYFSVTEIPDEEAATAVDNDVDGITVIREPIAREC